MAPPKSSHPPAAHPSRIIFDPWNSSATGHQRAENRPANGTAWRASRTRKLAHQYYVGVGGGERIHDSVAAGSLNHENDGRKGNEDWEDGASGPREDRWGDVRQMLLREGPKVVGKKEVEQDGTSLKGEGENKNPPLKSERRKLFQNLRVYINGSTAPMVGDHKLKQLLTENGAGISIALGRRSVTHVILGTPNGCRNGPGAGGGLAASKIQKEIKRVGGCGVKYVGVEWVLESIKAGKRLPEAQFSNIAIAPNGQKSVYGMFRKSAEDSQDANAVSKSTTVLTKAHHVARTQRT